MSRLGRLSLLVVDDQSEVLEVYEDVLGAELGHLVQCATMPGEALRHARERLFDVALVDAKNTYRGSPLGGLILAEELGRILGVGSVLLMSQYDVREEVKHYNPAFTFVSKPRSGIDLGGWVNRELLPKIRELVKRQYAFVAMPYGDAMANEFYRERLSPWLREAGFTIRRMDELATSRPLNHALLERISQAHFFVFFADGNNPNAYFEAGYAFAHEKFVVVLGKARAELPFDIRSNHVVTIGPDRPDAEVREALLAFVSGLRGIQV